MNHETTAPSLRATAVSILRRLADRLASRAAKRPTIEAIKNGLAYDVEVQLLNAQGDEERARHTVNMLRERLTRLRHDQSDPPSRILACAGCRPTQGVCGGSWNHAGVPVPTGWPAVAADMRAALAAAGREVS